MRKSYALGGGRSKHERKGSARERGTHKKELSMRESYVGALGGGRAKRETKDS